MQWRCLFERTELDSSAGSGSTQAVQNRLSFDSRQAVKTRTGCLRPLCLPPVDKQRSAELTRGADLRSRQAGHLAGSCAAVATARRIPLLLDSGGWGAAWLQEVHTGELVVRKPRLPPHCTSPTVYNTMRTRPERCFLRRM